MGSCLSKKTTICCSPGALPDPPLQSKPKPQIAAETKKADQEDTVRKEIFVIKHRRSHDIDPRSDEEKARSDQKAGTSTSTTTSSEPAEIGNNCGSSNLVNGGLPNGGVVVRTSSCTKEELDAILIQCGRLSRSSSTGKSTLSGSGARKYSGSKRSYDFDHDTSNSDKGGEVIDGGDDVAAEADRIHRQRQRQSRPSSSSGRRRTPSRERDQQQRSGSRERGGSGGGRRVSRSPGRRSESPITGSAQSSANASGTNNGGSGSTNRPGKMVSVPATVSSMAMDKSNNGGGAEPQSAAAVTRIVVKRNVSPRSRSPASTNFRAANDNQQPLSLSRSNSRKAEHSPYRRNPLGEIDQNVIGYEVPPTTNKAANNVMSQTAVQQPNGEHVRCNKGTVQETNIKTSSGKNTLENKVGNSNCRTKEQSQMDECRGLQPMTSHVAVAMVASGVESLKPQAITRSRSSRLSRDLDLNPETLLNPPPSSYTALLLEDIQNFHQKSAPTITLPACVTKACSIVEAVADLNSSTSSNLSTAIRDDRKISPSSELLKKDDNSSSFGANLVGKKRLETKDPFVESEVLGSDDLMEPSFHKYVTLRRGGTLGGEDIEEQESSGSNSCVAGQQHWASSSPWDSNSADSTDFWTSRSHARQDDTNEARTRASEKKTESDHQQTGIGRGGIGSSRGLHSRPTLAAAST